MSERFSQRELVSIAYSNVSGQFLQIPRASTRPSWHYNCNWKDDGYTRPDGFTIVTVHAKDVAAQARDERLARIAALRVAVDALDTLAKQCRDRMMPDEIAALNTQRRHAHAVLHDVEQEELDIPSLK